MDSSLFYSLRPFIHPVVRQESQLELLTLRPSIAISSLSRVSFLNHDQHNSIPSRLTPFLNRRDAFAVRGKRLKQRRVTGRLAGSRTPKRQQQSAHSQCSTNRLHVRSCQHKRSDSFLFARVTLVPS